MIGSNGTVAFGWWWHAVDGRVSVLVMVSGHMLA